jgi:hypothetical protein
LDDRNYRQMIASVGCELLEALGHEGAELIRACEGRAIGLGAREHLIGRRASAESGVEIRDR